VEESSATVSGVIAAIDESLALAYEDASMAFNLARARYLAAGGDVNAVAATATGTMRGKLYGEGPSESTLRERLEAKLVADAPTRVAELQSLRAPKGGLLHMASDDNTCLAMACQVEGDYPNRKLEVTASAQTRMIHGAVLKPDGTWRSKQQHVVDMKEQYGEPCIWCSDNLPTHAKELKQEMPSTWPTQDFIHYFNRAKNTTNSYAPSHAAVVSNLRNVFLQLRRQKQARPPTLPAHTQPVADGHQPSASTLPRTTRSLYLHPPSPYA